MNAIAIITARGGSKRIPYKNIKNFYGKPIIAYSIQAALKSGLFEEVMVSTDDKKIAEMATFYGAKVPFYRSAKASDDYATTVDVLREVLNEYQKSGRTFDWMCCLYPTAPFVTAKKLQQAMAMMEAGKADALVPIVQFSYPPQRCFVMQNNKLAYKYLECVNTRSQDLEPLYHDAGQFYLAKVKTFLKSNSLVTDNTISYLLSEMEAQDIDTLEDWKIAEVKYRIMIENGNVGKYD